VSLPVKKVSCSKHEMTMTFLESRRLAQLINSCLFETIHMQILMWTALYILLLNLKLLNIPHLHYCSMHQNSPCHCNNSNSIQTYNHHHTYLNHMGQNPSWSEFKNIYRFKLNLNKIFLNNEMLSNVPILSRHKPFKISLHVFGHLLLTPN
jgi:hypothetical protein